jgi:hypothetical protein
MIFLQIDFFRVSVEFATFLFEISIESCYFGKYLIFRCGSFQFCLNMNHLGLVFEVMLDMASCCEIRGRIFYIIPMESQDYGKFKIFSPPDKGV